MWRALRIGVLLLVLVVVAGVTIGDRLRTTAWTDTLWIGVFPVNADGRSATQRYIGGLQPADFDDIEAFFAREAERWGVGLAAPVDVRLEPVVAELPPALAADAGPLGRALWSLRTRLYARRAAAGSLADIRVFVLYHDPAAAAAVPHSVGLQKGLLGVVHAWADPAMTGENAIVVAHEVLHALGATDKYDPRTSQPLFPDGYAEPQAGPRHPQRRAEVMAGRVALSASTARMPEDLAGVVVGARTAAEIGWPPAR